MKSQTSTFVNFGRAPRFVAAVVFLAALAVSALPAHAQNDAANTDDAANTTESPADSASKSAEPSTTQDPAIPVDYLDLLVKPLTKDELTVEADAWRDLLKAKVSQIGQQQIAIAEKAAAVEASSKAETEAQSDAEAKPQSDAETKPKDATGSDIANAAVINEKQEMAEGLPELQEQQSHLVDRLNVVIDALEEKGGEVESYRQYISAVTGISFAVGDTATTWTLIKGWLASEKGGQRWLWNLAKFAIILFGFYFAASIVANLARHAVSRVKGTSQLLVNFVSKFVKQTMMIVGLIVALTALEVNISPLLAAVGAAGFVVAFALQGTLSNFASGLLILAYRPFDVGNVIEAAGISGIVDSVSLFSTHVRTFDNKMMIVPNNDIWGGTITNASVSDTRRVDLTFGIGYDDDTEAAKSILERLVQDHPLVLSDPAPVVKLHELADSSINFICRPWSNAGDYWTVYWDLTQSVKQEFDKNGISIPFPQRDVHVYQESKSTDT